MGMRGGASALLPGPCSDFTIVVAHAEEDHRWSLSRVTAHADTAHGHLGYACGAWSGAAASGWSCCAPSGVRIVPHWWVGMARHPCRRRTGPRRAMCGSSKSRFYTGCGKPIPRSQTIDKEVLNEQNELRVILNRQVEMEAVRPLMKTLLTQMAKAFPRQHLTVIAYAPTQPPTLMGTARFNARTRQMTYTPAVPQ
jgi:hypothetical protein